MPRHANAVAEYSQSLENSQLESLLFCRLHVLAISCRRMSALSAGLLRLLPAAAHLAQLSNLLVQGIELLLDLVQLETSCSSQNDVQEQQSVWQ
jgi:hypothetical protein